jgi:NAD kinase
MKALVVCKHSRNSKEARVCHLINHDGIDVKYSWKNTLTKKDMKGVDFVISIGGDGTALSASHYLIHRPLLAVNSDPRGSEGALTTIELKELPKKLEEIKRGNHKIEKLERIKVFINGKHLNPLVLNEVFIANEDAYLISKYKIKFNGNEEEQRSSGLIFSTGTGSTAWYKSAGGESFSPQAKYIRMITREPYFGKLHKFSMVKRKINQGESIEITPLTKMVLAVDSIREVKLNEKDSIKIKISKWPLLRIK